MGFHTYDPEDAENLEDDSRYARLSREELLSALDLDGDETVADLGSGTGFYTDDVAPHASRVYAVDVQEEMHDLYREKGVPGNVELVEAEVSGLPFEDSSLDASFSTMTFHEFAGPEALEELGRVLKPGAKLVIADWSANGTADSGPPLKERYTAREAEQMLEDHGFKVRRKEERVETWKIFCMLPS
ncbi:MAG: class I SAM-dependent methyltransferase [Candidatus Aenigmatarchaeota archaeon]